MGSKETLEEELRVGKKTDMVILDPGGKGEQGMEIYRFQVFFSMGYKHVLPFGVFMKDSCKDLTNFTFWGLDSLRNSCMEIKQTIDTALSQNGAIWHQGFLHEIHKL